MSDIKFGTDGWRAIVGEDFTKDNVKVVTNAIAKYIFDNYGIYKTVLIGYDPRNKADEFSLYCAEILAESGFKVLYSDKVVPTPVLAYNAKLLDACAIMFTASHNPPQYLGIKFIPDYAGPATKEITDEIVDNLGKNIYSQVKGKIVYYDFSEDYFKNLNKIINFDRIKNSLSKNQIIFDGLYSASIGYFDKLLSDKNIRFDALHMYHDTNFGGMMPEPKPQYMAEMIQYVKTHNVDITKFPLYVGFANDGDGDRFGVINEKGEYVTPNEILAILLLHLKKNKGYSGCFVKTVAGSMMLDILCEKLGIDVIETAVGFKNVGQAMRDYNPIIAGEESGGLSIQGYIPEKDGILANLLILEAMAYSNKFLFELQDEINSIVNCEFINTRIDKKLDSDELVRNAIDNVLNSETIANYSIIKKDTKDGVKVYLDDNKTWVLIRPSGTEPLLRIYIESDSKEVIDNIKDYVETSF